MRVFGYGDDFRHQNDPQKTRLAHSRVYRDYHRYLASLGFLPFTPSQVQNTIRNPPVDFNRENLVPGNFYLVIERRHWDAGNRDDWSEYGILYVNALDWNKFRGSSQAVGIFYLKLGYLNQYPIGADFVSYDMGGWMPVSGESGSVLPDGNKSNSYFSKNMYFWKLSVPDQVGLFNWRGF